jgi:Spy/CpxP family protein refolding chaperone
MGGGPVFLEQLFPPELVMRSQSELALTSTQQATMTQIMAETQAKLVELQWKLEAAMQTLTKILEKDTVDETAALSQWDQLSGFEQQIKKEHVRLLIRIKNQLTPSQQEKLRALRFSRPGPPPPRHGPED